MKQFLLFMGGDYASGSWNDFQGDFDTADEARGKRLQQHGFRLVSRDRHGDRYRDRSVVSITPEQAVVGSKWLWRTSNQELYKIRITGKPALYSGTLHSYLGKWEVAAEYHNKERDMWFSFIAILDYLFPLLDCEDCQDTGIIERRLVGFDHSWIEPCHCKGVS